MTREPTTEVKWRIKSLEKRRTQRSKGVEGQSSRIMKSPRIKADNVAVSDSEPQTQMFKELGRVAIARKR